MYTTDQLRDYVYQRLESLVSLPATGFLAGGAVANLIWECITQTPAVINDVDVFTVKEVKPINLEENFYRDFTIADVYNNNVSENNYRQIVYRETGGNYIRVIKSERVDLINHVSYNTNLADIRVLLHSFDLNAVMCGINLSTRELVLLDEFSAFLENKQLRIVNMNTPGHSVIRALCKAEDMGLSYNVRSQIDDLRTVLSNHMAHTRRCIGEKYYEKFQRFTKELSPYFKLLDHTGQSTHKIWFFSLTQPKSSYYTQGYTFHNVTMYNNYINTIKNNPVLLQVWRTFEMPWHIYESNTNKSFLEGLPEDKLRTPEIQRLIKQAAKILTYNKAYMYGERPLIDTLQQLQWLDELIQENKEPLYRIAYQNQDAMVYCDTKEELAERLIILRIRKRKEVQKAKDKSKRKNDVAGLF